MDPSQAAMSTVTSTTIPSTDETAVSIVRARPTVVDVTLTFSDGAAALPTGRLFQDESFTLFDAVGALEIGDAKMDSGHLDEAKNFEDEYDVLRPLLPDELVGILDQLLCIEVRASSHYGNRRSIVHLLRRDYLQAAWHKGYPLSQTLFTSTYINRLLWPTPQTLVEARFHRRGEEPSGEPLTHQLLRAYCLGTIKSCDFVHRMVSSQHYYEVCCSLPPSTAGKCSSWLTLEAPQEEDFAPQLFHRELLHRFQTEDVQSVLDNALSRLGTTDLTLEMKTAIESRLTFRKELLDFLSFDADPSNVRPLAFLSCLPSLRVIRHSHPIGRPVPESFNLRIQRTLASSIPPRPMIAIDWEDAIAYFEQLYRDTADVGQLLELGGGENLLTALWTLMSREPPTSVYVRSVVQSFLSRNDKVMGQASLERFMIGDIKHLVLPGNPFLDRRPSTSDGATCVDLEPHPRSLLVDFVSRCSVPYINIFRTVCLNRCRIRRTLCHAVIEWDNIQAEAEELDVTLRRYTGETSVNHTMSTRATYFYPLSSWAYHYKLYQLEQIVKMGFELSIYAHDELPNMYWYLSQLCMVHVSHLDRISFFLQRYGESNGGLDSRIFADGGLGHVDRTAIDTSLQRLFRTFSPIKAAEALARALHKLYVVIMRHELLPRPPRPYSSRELRFELRMRPFLPLSTPDPFSYDEFDRDTSLWNTPDLQILVDAGAAVTEAKKGWEEVLRLGWSSQTEHPSRKAHHHEPEPVQATTIQAQWTRDVKDTLRACIATSLAIVTLKKSINESVTRKYTERTKVHVPRPGEKDCWHRWWLVPKIMEV